ncbi:MAG: FecR domain-containing protein [Armatimonadota bacterium]|nr:MAG: FecR domain-containing protein [Armatimonadota bacterium]
MYRSAVILIVAAVLAVILLLVCAQTLAIVEMLAVVDERAGPVQVLRGGDARDATVGMLVRSGDLVRTGPQGLIGLHWADGSRIELGPNSELVVERCRANKVRKTRSTHFRLNLGEIWIRIRGALQPGSKFEVETPTIVAAVRGTVFGLEVLHDGTTRLEVYDGQVEIIGDGVAQSVESGRSGKCAVVGKRGFEVHNMSEAEAERWRGKADVIGPLLTVTEPAPDSSTSVALAPVRGRTEEAATVTVNGEPVRVGANGVFRSRARLVQEQNVITIVASLGGRRTTVSRAVAYVNPTDVIALTWRPSKDPHDAPGVMEVKAVLRDPDGELVPDGTPVELVVDSGDIIGGHRTEHGAVVAKWRPAESAVSARITVTSGQVAASAIVSPSAPPTALPSSEPR